MTKEKILILRNLRSANPYIHITEDIKQRKPHIVAKKISKFIPYDYPIELNSFVDRIVTDEDLMIRFEEALNAIKI